MAFADVVASLKIAEIKKIYSFDNVAWILNCIPLQNDQEAILKQDLDKLSKDEGINYHVVDGFIMMA
jgi:hypothetical protein